MYLIVFLTLNFYLKITIAKHPVAAGQQADDLGAETEFYTIRLTSRPESEMAGKRTPKSATGQLRGNEKIRRTPYVTSAWYNAII